MTPPRFGRATASKLFGELASVLVLVTLTGCAAEPAIGSVARESTELLDRARERSIPVELYLPHQHHRCIRTAPCPVALLSPGYGLRRTDYTFLAEALAKTGYLVVAVQHDLPSDPPPGRTGDLIADRTPMWRRGAENLRFVRDALAATYAGYDWAHLTLIGHSNGGDISAFALSESSKLATTLITLDNRRFPLPRDPKIEVLSIRGSDFAADPGVLPSTHEPGNACITEIAKARHDDMNDQGPAWLQHDIGRRVLRFLGDGECAAAS